MSPSPDESSLVLGRSAPWPRIWKSASPRLSSKWRPYWPTSASRGRRIGARPWAWSPATKPLIASMSTRSSTEKQTAKRPAAPLFMIILALFLAQDQINHPAATDMRPWPPAVVQDVATGAAGLLQSVGQDRHAGE